MGQNLVLTVLERDPETNSEIATHVLPELPWAELAGLLDIEEGAAELADECFSYDLDAEDMALLAQRFGLEYQSGVCCGSLSNWADIPGRPYALHTNRELWMMLREEKPLAAFLVEDGASEILAFDGQPFQTYVDQKRLIRYDCHFELQGCRLHRILFALPGEEWRFKAYELMCDLSLMVGWSDTLERMEGRLLGYEDWQTEWHLANRSKD